VPEREECEVSADMPAIYSGAVDLRDKLIVYLRGFISDAENATSGPWQVWDGPDYVGGGRDLCIGAGEKWLFNMDHRICEARDHHIFHCELKDATDIASTGAGCELCLSDENLENGSPLSECRHTDIITAEQRANANLMAASRTLVPMLARAILAEIDRHHTVAAYDDGRLWCAGCETPCPCPVVSRFAGALKADGR
jgi:hypothetical protein